MMNISDFYRAQGSRTKVEKGTFDDFPDDIAEICRIIHGLLVHPGALDLHDLHFSKERINNSRYRRTIQESIDQVKEFEDKPLIERRDPEKRVVNNCRHFSMFICSVLREKGIPARCRCGFAIYLENGWFEDHWICEYWNKEENRWVRVDAQVDEVQVEGWDINKKIDFCDLPKDAFFSGGVLWKLYRQGLISGDLCGFSLEEDDHGAWYVLGNMLRDFFALNKIEYTYQEVSRLMDRNHEPTEEDLLLLDEIADLTINVDDDFGKLTSFYEDHKDLMPE